METLKIKGEAVFSPAIRVYLVLLLPIIAFVQFFFPYSTIIAGGIAVVLLFVGLAGFDLHYLYEYDPDKNLYRKSKVSWGVKSGSWVELKSKCNYIAFQMFNQNYEVSFMNMYTTATQEQVFVVRFVKADGSYQTMVETTDYNQIPSCIHFCKLVSVKNEVPYRDFVREQVAKIRRN